MVTDQTPPGGSPDSEDSTDPAPPRGSPAVGHGDGEAPPNGGPQRKRANPLWLRLVPVICTLLAAFFLVPGLRALVDDWRFMDKAAPADGVVIRLAPIGVDRYAKKHDVEVIFYHPVIRFVTARGQHVTFQATQGSESRPAYQIGQSVGILYNPQHPEDARLDTWFSRWGPVDNLLFGFLFLLLGILGSQAARLDALIATWRRRRRA
jgi:hypothetical protein